MVVAITTCTANAAVAPSQTAKGRPRVAMIREANMVLSGSSPRKITAEDHGDDGKVHAGPFLYRSEGQSASRDEDPPSSRPRTDPRRLG